MSVRSIQQRTQQRETTLFFTQDGLRYALDVPARRVILTEEGLGMPEIQYVSQRGPYQHGETLRDYFLRPRVMQFVVRHNYCSRDEYWAGRAALLDVLRPNRAVAGPAQGTLRRVFPNGSVRDITCIIQSGPNFAPRGVTKTSAEWDEWAYVEALKFIAYNPVWFDPQQHTITLSLNAVVATFPMTFPVSFIGFSLTNTIVYAGDWAEYPTITITGPFSNLTITNVTTGEKIALVGNIAVGQSVIITLTYGLKTVTLGDGTNVIGFITADSDLATWHLQAGNNVIDVVGTNTGVATSVTFSWYDRFIGI